MNTRNGEQQFYEALRNMMTTNNTNTTHVEPNNNEITNTQAYQNTQKPSNTPSSEDTKNIQLDL